MVTPFKLSNGTITLIISDVIEILNQHKLRFVVIGGLSAYLQAAFFQIHPGTADVDVLLSNVAKEQDLENIIGAFLAKGYIRRKGCRFRLYKYVRTSHPKIISCLDLLHPWMLSKRKPSLAHEAFKEDENGHAEVSIDSVGSLMRHNSQVIFNERLFSTFTLSHIAFPLINETGLILCKMSSVFAPCRERDAYDIYCALMRKINVSRDLSSLMKRHNFISQLIDNFKTKLENEYLRKEFGDNVTQFAIEKINGPASEIVLSSLPSAANL